jgi:hypothetical protein
MKGGQRRGGLLGAAVAKQFEGFGTKKFRGQVGCLVPIPYDGDACKVQVSRDDGELGFLIVYEDGDREHVDEEELEQILIRSEPKRRLASSSPGASSKLRRVEEERVVTAFDSDLEARRHAASL